MQNKWDLKLMEKLLDFSNKTEGDELNLEKMNQRLKLTSFSIQEGINIYSSRVDSLYGLTMGLIVGIFPNSESVLNKKFIIKKESQLKIITFKWKFRENKVIDFIRSIKPLPRRKIFSLSEQSSSCLKSISISSKKFLHKKFISNEIYIETYLFSPIPFVDCTDNKLSQNETSCFCNRCPLIILSIHKKKNISEIIPKKKEIFCSNDQDNDLIYMEKRICKKDINYRPQTNSDFYFTHDLKIVLARFEVLQKGRKNIGFFNKKFKQKWQNPALKLSNKQKVFTFFTKKSTIILKQTISGKLKRIEITDKQFYHEGLVFQMYRCFSLFFLFYFERLRFLQTYYVLNTKVNKDPINNSSIFDFNLLVNLNPGKYCLHSLYLSANFSQRSLKKRKTHDSTVVEQFFTDSLVNYTGHGLELHYDKNILYIF